jgi:hypothetical protein
MDSGSFSSAIRRHQIPNGMSTSATDRWELDTIDKPILEEGLRIQSLHFNPEMNLMLILLNNGMVIQRDLSDFPTLKGASVEQLNAFELSRTGVHWPELDEDLSLRGFLKHEMLNVLGERKEAA